MTPKQISYRNTANGMIEKNGHLCWDHQSLAANVVAGMKKCAEIIFYSFLIAVFSCCGNNAKNFDDFPILIKFTTTFLIHHFIYC